MWDGGPTVGCVGFGGWGIGGQTPGDTSYGNTDDATSIAALQAAVAAGETLFDTAPAYGDGRSEALIGEALAEVRDRVTICSKVGVSSWQGAPDFSAEAIEASVEGSLRRLRTDRIDALYLHSPGPETLADDRVFAVLDALRDKGVIGAWGISCKGPGDALAVLERRPVALFQVNLNMLDLRALDCGLLARAEGEGIGIVARTPLNFGFLTGAVDETTPLPEGDHRRAWSTPQVAAWADGARKLMAITGAAPGDQACIAAIRFCLSFPGVAAVLPGVLKPEEVAVHAEAGRLGPLPADQVDAILDLNRRQSFFVRPAATPV